MGGRPVTPRPTTGPVHRGPSGPSFLQIREECPRLSVRGLPPGVDPLTLTLVSPSTCVFPWRLYPRRESLECVTTVEFLLSGSLPSHTTLSAPLTPECVQGGLQGFIVHPSSKWVSDGRIPEGTDGSWVSVTFLLRCRNPTPRTP